jgi:hypothetical protein
LSASDEDRIFYLAGEQVDSLTPAERAELDEVRSALEAEGTWAEPPADFEDRVVAAVAQAAGTTHSPAPRPVHAPRAARVADRPAASRPAQRSWTALILARPAYAFSLIGALVAVVAVLTLLSNSGSNNAPSRLRFAMVLTGTALAPNAHGSASVTRTSSGWRIELSANGLPRLDNGRYYEAWLKNPAGILVPVGTFNDAVNVTVWSGVPVTEFRSLTVTRQLVDGNSASSGQGVLVGTITAHG